MPLLLHNPAEPAHLLHQKIIFAPSLQQLNKPLIMTNHNQLKIPTRVLFHQSIQKQREFRYILVIQICRGLVQAEQPTFEAKRLFQRQPDNNARQHFLPR